MTERSVGAGTHGSRVTDAATNAMGRIKEQASDAADKAAGSIDSNRQPFADRLHAAAGTIRDRAAAGSEAVGNAAESAAERLDASATYIESRTARQMMHDLLGVIKKHPTQSLLVAGFLGFLVARALRKD